MKTDKQSYYGEASTWARSDAEAAQRARNLAWMVAGAAVLVAVMEALALAALAPLKSTSVVPVLVDRQTGFVQVLNKDGSQALSADSALTRSMLAQYVEAREGFNITTLSTQYHEVMLWSADRARSGYAALMPAQNPQSPLRLYPRSALVAVNIESVSDLGPRTALVRFSTTRMDDGAPAGAPSYYAAVVTYQFADGPLRAEDRLVNPLGFQVTHYERTDETAPPPPKPAGTVLDIPITPGEPTGAAPTHLHPAAGAPAAPPSAAVAPDRRGADSNEPVLIEMAP